MQDKPFFDHLLYGVFGESPISVPLPERLINFRRISEELWRNDEISFQNVYENLEPVDKRKRGMIITHCVCDFIFLLWVPLHDEVVVSENLWNSTL